MTAIENVLSHLERVKKSATGFTACCPAHEDGRPSLSIREGDDGRVLLHCHAGCTVDAIVAAVDMTMKDLFPVQPYSAPKKLESSATFTEEKAMSALLRSVHGSDGDRFRLVRTYDYDLIGGGVLRVLRYEDETGAKTIRQMTEIVGVGWVLRRGDAPTLPYMYADLSGEQSAWVVEGEKCAGALRDLGIPATTSAGGAKVAAKTCWDGLDGMHLVLSPDNDESGEAYVRDVMELCRPASVRVVELPDLGPGGDVADFIESRKALGVIGSAVRDELNGLAQEAGCLRVAAEPFPIDLFPTPVADMIRSIAESRSVDPSVPSACAIAAIASAVGLSRVAYDDYADWEEILVVWVALVSRSGTRKTIVQDDLLAPHNARQLRFVQEYEAARKRYDQDCENWKQRQKKNKPPEAEPKPEEPTLKHVYTTDTTPEGLVDILACSPRGISATADELATLFGFGRYTGKADQERGFYLSLFRGVPYKKDRRSGPSIMIERAAVSIVGGIQPGILRNAFDKDAFHSGLASRFLLVNPSPSVKRYTRGPSEAERAAYADFIDALFALQMEPYSRADGEIGYRPLRVLVSEHARDLLLEFVPDWSAEALTSSADVEAAMSKLEGYAIRFALMFRVCREATGESVPEDPITRDDLRSGIELARWFRDRAIEVYQDLRSGRAKDGASTLQARVAVIRDRFGGAVTAWEWQKLNTRRTVATAKAELDELVRAELAEWRDRRPGGKGGRPTKECAVLDLGPPKGEVSGCWLLGAGSADQGPDTPSGAEKGCGGSEDVGCCNQKPPREAETTRDEAPELDNHLEPVERSGADVTGRCSDPRNIRCNQQPETSLGTPDGGGICDRSQKGAGADTDGQQRRDPATSNRQPITPVGGAADGDPARAGDKVQPETSDADAFVEHLKECFDGVAVPPLGSDDEFVSISEIARTSSSATFAHPPQCYACRGRTWWRLPHVDNWVCARCHPSPYPADEIVVGAPGEVEGVVP